MAPEIEITVAGFHFRARLETEAAPRTCAAVRAMLPVEGDLVQARWSGEACWVPLGEMALEVPPENATSYPGVGELLFYPGGVSETEILVPYGPTVFGSRAGQLAGNHFATILDAQPRLPELGAVVLRRGVQTIALRDG